MISKAPGEKELDLLSRLYKEEYGHFSAHPDKAKAILSVGEYEHMKELDEITLAANTVVASTIINFDEFVMKR